MTADKRCQQIDEQWKANRRLADLGLNVLCCAMPVVREWAAKK